MDLNLVVSSRPMVHWVKNQEPALRNHLPLLLMLFEVATPLLKICYVLWYVLLHTRHGRSVRFVRICAICAFCSLFIIEHFQIQTEYRTHPCAVRFVQICANFAHINSLFFPSSLLPFFELSLFHSADSTNLIPSSLSLLTISRRRHRRYFEKYINEFWSCRFLAKNTSERFLLDFIRVLVFGSRPEVW